MADRVAPLSPVLPLAVRDAAVARWSVVGDRGLVCRVRPTWVGTRPYTTTDGRVVVVLRRPSQVNSAGHLETVKRVTGTRRHPERAGKPVFLSATAEPGSPAPWDPGVELRPPRDYFAASVGDEITMVRVPRMGLVPELAATLQDAELIADVRTRGLVEVSYGYVSYFVAAADVAVDGDEIPETGKWRNPETGQLEPFDLEGLCDPTDPRVPDELRDYLGGNHLAFAVPRGRGGPEVRVVADAAHMLLDDATSLVPGAVRNVRAWGLHRKVDESGVSGVGLVAVALEVEGGPAAAVWLTETASATAYDSLATFTAIHIGNHSPDANELVPLALGLPLAAKPAEPAPQPQQPEEPMNPNQNPPQPPTDPSKAPPQAPPQQQPPKNDADDPAALKAQITELTTANAALTAKVAELTQRCSALEAAQGEMDKARGAAAAKCDALEEELRPHREAALRARRAALCEALDAAADDEVGKQIVAASADDLSAVAVGLYYKARPDIAPADLDKRLKDPAYVAVRADLLVEQRRRGTNTGSGTSDAFAQSFRPAPTHTPTPTAVVSSQGQLDAMMQ